MVRSEIAVSLEGERDDECRHAESDHDRGEHERLRQWIRVRRDIRQHERRAARREATGGEQPA